MFQPPVGAAWEVAEREGDGDADDEGRRRRQRLVHGHRRRADACASPASSLLRNDSAAGMPDGPTDGPGRWWTVVAQRRYRRNPVPAAHRQVNHLRLMRHLIRRQRLLVVRSTSSTGWPLVLAGPSMSSSSIGPRDGTGARVGRLMPQGRERPAESASTGVRPACSGVGHTTPRKASVRQASMDRVVATNLWSAALPEYVGATLG